MLPGCVYMLRLARKCHSQASDAIPSETVVLAEMSRAVCTKISQVRSSSMDDGTCPRGSRATIACLAVVPCVHRDRAAEVDDVSSILFCVDTRYSTGT